MELNDLMANLKWSELESVEETLGAPMDEWEDYPSKAKLSFSLQYVLAKRNKPELTVEEAKEMSIADLTALATPSNPKAK